MNSARINQNLNLGWKFTWEDISNAWYKGMDDSSWCDISLPHDWSVEAPFSQEHSSGTGYLPGGVGWYRKHFYVPNDLAGKRVYITFEGIYNNAQVWCNSYYIGKRPYGYSSFTYDITDFVSFSESDNVISVKVNHRDIADSRWFTGSGIYRDVYLTITDSIHIDQYGVFVTTPEVTSEQAKVSVNVQLLNETENEEQVDIKNTLLDHLGVPIGSIVKTSNIQGISSLNVDQQMAVHHPNLWSPDNPYLYSIRTEVMKDGEIVDNVTTPIGIRYFSFDPEEGFFLNDVNMKIKGVCVHHDAGALGAAVPKKVWIRRLKILKEMGCNAIRMSHNPPVPYLLDLCDQMGFLVMDEAFDEWEGVKNKWSRGHNVYPPKHFGYSEDFPQWGEIDIKEMVLRDRNHPSIILWSIGNEVDYPNDPYCHPYFKTMTGNNDANKPAAERQYDPDKPNAERLTTISKKLAQYVKECDTTRPVTAAVAFPELSNLTGYTDTLDVVGYNYKEHLYEEDHRKYPNRVIYGSENSHSLEDWLTVKNNDYICGQFIWTGIDFLGEAQGWPIRASQAGVLDLAGFKKPSYYFRQSLWSDKPMVYLSAKTLESQDDWYGESHWNWRSGEKIQVQCFTNGEEVELFLNGRSLGSKKVDKSKNSVTWVMNFAEGELKAVAKHANGEDSSFFIHTSAEPEGLKVSTDCDELKANGQEIAHLEIKVTDQFGNLVYLADNDIRLSINGPGEIIGLENGNAQDVRPYSEPMRKVYKGKLLAYVRSTTDTGEITVRAESANLISGEVNITVTSINENESIIAAKE
ncbi:glycoside hydrolase family 2 TIM barrel-domain containing protein [Gracilibacillus sp. S3-1-1]|uniref:Glycoside hydrolase family 2 TIM barrel-domain containing protein n=1 Tax=Gracilibacillus pellucidus TaxID=3095368 RepID=A0ACC6M2Z6_9BACI|nr:glycoside hydrolase family 2 TIM barrel-domain containing protein [Gracilibacillus sp. S3-1-1]MDX8045307.1 glycoside hydrolase family 2 TIM barrel-domain containing protein [Gracilibacillus sp. S3-1-1]